MTEQTNDVVDTDAAPYTEDNPNHVPDPTSVYGTLDTSATAGGEHERLEGITPVFDAAKAQDLQYAADALDPENKENTDTASVVLPEDHISNDEAKENVAAAAEAAAGVKVQDPSLTEAEKDNEAKEKGELTPNDVAAQQAAASPAGGTAGSTPATQGSAGSGTADTSGTSGAAPAASGTPAPAATAQTGPTGTAGDKGAGTTPPAKAPHHGHKGAGDKGTGK